MGAAPLGASMAHPAHRPDPFGTWGEAQWRRLAALQSDWMALADACWRLSGARPGDTVADVGCGPGVFALRYSQLGGDVAAVDVNRRALDLVPRAARLRTLLHDAARSPLPGRPYDVLFLTDVLHHAVAPASLLRQLRASGTTLVVSETDPAPAQGGHGQGRPGPPRLSSGEALDLLRAAGWKPGPVVPGQPFGHWSVVAR